MADSKTSTLTDVCNGIYDKISTYSNTYCTEVSQLFTDFSIDPITLEVSALTVKQRGALFGRLAEFLTIVGQEVSGRTLETQLMAAGYASIDEAIADVPMRFVVETQITAMQTNLTALKNMLATIDGIVNPQVLHGILSAVNAVSTGLISSKAVVDTV